jgi:copper chaperone NosL
MKLKSISRIIIAIASLGLIITYFVPLWGIYLFAPQYPEGLKMNIWLNKLTGQIDTINGLNHYIGMKHITPEMFPELNFLGYIAGFYILFGLLVAIRGRKQLLLYFLLLCIAGGIAAMLDFYNWGYNYGHDLDPKAPIQVAGLSYQPPLIGHRRLLNFDAYSYPALGGWIFIVVGILSGIIWFFESFKIEGKKIMKKISIVVPGILILNGCTIEPEPINYGKDNCASCQMTIMDSKFSGQILTKKGKIFKFDDAICVVEYLKSNQIESNQVKSILLSNFLNHGEFLDASLATLIKSDDLKSPMNGNVSAVEANKADSLFRTINGDMVTWQQYYDSN